MGMGAENFLDLLTEQTKLLKEIRDLLRVLVARSEGYKVTIASSEDIDITESSLQDYGHVIFSILDNKWVENVPEYKVIVDEFVRKGWILIDKITSSKIYVKIKDKGTLERLARYVARRGYVLSKKNEKNGINEWIKKILKKSPAYVRAVGRVVFGVLEEGKLPFTSVYISILKNMERLGIVKISEIDSSNMSVKVEIKNKKVLEELRNKLLSKGYRPQRRSWKR